MENTSGQGKTAIVPEEVKGLSWGAFLFSWLWGLFNRTWIALLVLVPIVGLVMWVMLLFKGREWAWRNKHWDSIEHFNKVQRQWAKAGLIILCVPFLLGIIAAIVIPIMGKKAEQNVGNTLLPASPPTITTAKEPLPPAAAPAPAQNTVPAAPKLVGAVVEPPSPATIATKTTPDVIASAPEPAKPVPAAPVQTHQPPSVTVAAADQKALAKLPRNINSAVKKPASRPKRHEPADRRDCLNLLSNEAIAKCAGE